MAISTSPAASATPPSHWRTLAFVAAAAAVVGGVSYLVLSSSSSSSSPVSTSSQKQKKRKSKAGASKAPTATDTAAALAATESVDVASKDTTASTASPPTEVKSADDTTLLTCDIAALSDDERKSMAKEAKSAGNKYFAEKQYKEAISYYSRAIDLHPDAIYYANRAACWANMSNYENVIQDCIKSLDLDPRYIKAIYRRGQAYQSIGKLEDALKDYTAICMLEEFKKESSIHTTDRILKEIGQQKTVEVMKTKESRLPSHSFVKAYMDSFRPPYLGAEKVAGLDEKAEGDSGVKEAFKLALNHKWVESEAVLSTAILSELSPAFEAHALSLSGTYSFLRGDLNSAFSAFGNILEKDPKNVHVCIKRASIFMERGDIESAIREYSRAEEVGPNDADLYYHRGQIQFLTGNLASAISDYRKSLELDDEFVYAHIQLGVALYKEGKQAEATGIFKKAEKKFPDSPELPNYYGELLMDQGLFADAVSSFEKAITMNPTSPLPYINKAILHLQWKKDVETAEKLCRKAIEVDPYCDISFTQLAQLLIHQNRFDEALDCYTQAIDVSRTEPEVLNVITCREACAAQLYVSKLFPDIFSKLRASSEAI